MSVFVMGRSISCNFESFWCSGIFVKCVVVTDFCLLLEIGQFAFDLHIFQHVSGCFYAYCVREEADIPEGLHPPLMVMWVCFDTCVLQILITRCTVTLRMSSSTRHCICRTEGIVNDGRIPAIWLHCP
jgi:hypothetical protein